MAEFESRHAILGTTLLFDRLMIKLREKNLLTVEDTNDVLSSAISVLSEVDNSDTKAAISFIRHYWSVT